MHLRQHPPPLGSLGCCPFEGGGSVVIHPLFYVHVPPIVCGGSVLVFVLAFIPCVISSFAIILTMKIMLVALVLLSFRCLVTLNIFCGSSSRCRVLVCCVWLWYFLIILYILPGGWGEAVSLFVWFFFRCLFFRLLLYLFYTSEKMPIWNKR